jgi:hypothetical protein
MKGIMNTTSNSTAVEIAEPEGYGRLLDSSTPVEQEIEFVSEGNEPDGKEYSFYLGGITRSPMVKSRATGRLYFLPWSDLIKLAVAAGIDKPAEA